MVKAMFAAIAGLKAHQSKMDIISNNLANVNTWGYKARSANFADAMYQNISSGAKGNKDAGGTGGMNTSQLGYGVNIGSISTNYTSGSWNPTGEGLHCMINGPTFFIVGTMIAGGVANDAIATSGLSLSRVGIFTMDNNGYLVDDQGNYAYGYAVDADGKTFKTDTLTAISIPEKNTTTHEKYTIQSYTVSADGTIVGVDNDNNPHVIGKIAVASVGNPNGLEQKQGYLYNIGENAGTVRGVEGGNEATGKILGGYLEMANVDLATEMANMITTQRGYQANTKIITITDEMLEQLVNMKR